MRANYSRPQTPPALLKGLIFAPGGHAMTPSHTRKAGKLYRYYVAIDAIRRGYSPFQYDTELLKLARRSAAIPADSSPTRP